MNNTANNDLRIPTFDKCHSIVVLTNDDGKGVVYGGHYGITARDALFKTKVEVRQIGSCASVDFYRHDDPENSMDYQTAEELSDYLPIIKLAAGIVDKSMIVIDDYEQESVKVVFHPSTRRWCIVRDGECAAFSTEYAMLEQMKSITHAWNRFRLKQKVRKVA